LEKQYRIAKNVAQYIYGPSTALPLSALVACGAASGAFTSLVLTPIELVKCQMQVPAAATSTAAAAASASSSSPSSASVFSQSAARRPGLLALTRAIYRRHGVAGFWHGQLGTFIRESGGSAAWFGTYEAVLLLFRPERAEKLSLPRATAAPAPAPVPTAAPPAEASDAAPKPSLSQQMVAGAAAGVCYNFLFFPADTIKSRMQTEELGGGSTSKRTFSRVASELWQQQGLRGFYRGCGITVARSAPSSALIFTVYEFLKDYWS
jgi:ornithine carrier protein